MARVYDRQLLRVNAVLHAELQHNCKPLMSLTSALYSLLVVNNVDSTAGSMLFNIQEQCSVLALLCCCLISCQELLVKMQHVHYQGT